MQDDWLEKVVPAITERTERYSQSEIRFNLMAVIRNRKEAYSEKLQSLQQLQDRIESSIAGGAGVRQLSTAVCLQCHKLQCNTISMFAV